MSELIEDIREDIKREDLINIWHRYGKIIMAGLAAVVIGASSFFYWQHHKQKVRLANAAAYEKIMAELDPEQPQRTIKLLQDLQTKGSAGYRLLANLLEAGLSNDPAIDLKKMAENPKIEKDFQDIARILAALADLDGANPRAILDMLSSFETSASPFRPLAREIMGYALMRLGNGETAKNLFESLIRDQTAPHSLRLRAQAMVDYIHGKN